MFEASEQVMNEETAADLTPIAKVFGKPVLELPKDLYIPPDALEVFLETFEGPLDLLLYLIKNQNIDILNIPIAEITAQYIEYVELMKQFRLELAAEYLVMAAMLAEIKSRMLLPRPVTANVEEEDPRAELVRRLQEYERFKQAAEQLEHLPRQGRDVFQVNAHVVLDHNSRPLPQVELTEILLNYGRIMQRARLMKSHHVQREPLSVRDRMVAILSTVKSQEFSNFHWLFTAAEGRMGVVVTFVAVLELVRESMLECIQTEAFGAIYVKSVSEQPATVDNEIEVTEEPMIAEE